MELWIRSQNRKQLVKVYSIQVVPVNNGEKYGIITYNEMAGDFDLGVYKTKERALEVLDEIKDELISSDFMPNTENEVMTCGSARVYEMPLE